MNRSFWMWILNVEDSTEQKSVAHSGQTNSLFLTGVHLWITFSWKKRKEKKAFWGEVLNQVWKSFNKGASDHMRPRSYKLLLPVKGPPWGGGVVSLETSFSEQWVTSLLRAAGGESCWSHCASRCLVTSLSHPHLLLFLSALWHEHKVHSIGRWLLILLTLTASSRQDSADEASSTALCRGCSQDEPSSITSSWAFTLTAKMNLGAMKNFLTSPHTSLS